MTGQDFQDKLDAIVADLQTTGKGRTVNIMFRNPNNTPNVLPLSSDANGDVDGAQLAAINTFLSSLQDTADNLTTVSAPVQNGINTFKAAQAPHQAVIDAASVARTAMNDALTVDPVYQAAKTNLAGLRANVAYIQARDSYASQNVSENYAELSNAKGAYLV